MRSHWHYGELHKRESSKDYRVKVHSSTNVKQTRERNWIKSKDNLTEQAGTSLNVPEAAAPAASTAPTSCSLWLTVLCIPSLFQSHSFGEEQRQQEPSFSNREMLLFIALSLESDRAVTLKSPYFNFFPSHWIPWPGWLLVNKKKNYWHKSFSHDNNYRLGHKKLWDMLPTLTTEVVPWQCREWL